MQAATPPPPMQISGTAVSGAPITVPPPPASIVDIPVPLPKKPDLLPNLLPKKKSPLDLVIPLLADGIASDP